MDKGPQWIGATSVETLFSWIGSRLKSSDKTHLFSIQEELPYANYG